MPEVLLFLERLEESHSLGDGPWACVGPDVSQFTTHTDPIFTPPPLLVLDRNFEFFWKIPPFESADAAFRTHPLSLVLDRPRYAGATTLQDLASPFEHGAFFGRPA